LLTSTTQYSKTATTSQTVLFADHSIINQTTTNESLDSVHRNIFDNNNAATIADVNGTQSQASVTKVDKDSSTESDDDDEVQDWSYLLTTMYVVFDIETTGFSKLRNHIIEIAAQMLDPMGQPYGESFSSLINPLRRLNPFIQNLTGIQDKDLFGKPMFKDVATDFAKYITTAIHQFEQDNKKK
jgi:hypothetical protein